MNKKLSLGLLLALHCGASTKATTWNSVALGGAGAIVTGVYTIPGSGSSPGPANNVWIRTDVGGAYRFTPTGTFDPNSESTWGSWTSVTNTFPLDWAEYFACDGFAINPVAPNILFYAGGLDHGHPGAILKTSDGGANWHQTNVPASLLIANTIDGNGLNRYAGDRMGLSPVNRNYLVYGSRLTGAWYSTNAGEDWQTGGFMPSASDLADPDYTGVQCVAFDTINANRVYCAVSLHGVYFSDDHGATWTHMNGTSNSPERLKVGPDGTVWYTTAYGIQKYSGGSWSLTMKPGIDADGPYCGLAINPFHANEVIVQQGSQGQNAQGKGTGKIWRTTDGSTWNEVKYDNSSAATATLDTQQTWWTIPVYRFSPADLAFDPTLTSSSTSEPLRGGQWFCPKVNIPLTSNANWYQIERGHEENVMLCLACPPDGAGTKDYELLEGSLDDTGLAWTKLTLGSYPLDDLASNPIMGDISRISYCESSPSHMMRTNGQNGLVVARSADGGDTWTKDAGFPAGVTPEDVAVSGTIWQAGVAVCKDRVLVSSTSQVWSTSVWQKWDSTQSKYVSASAPMSSSKPVDDGWQVLAADHVNGSSFYYLDTVSDSTKAQVWVSSDRGVTFQLPQNAATNLPGAFFQYSIKSQPGAQGNVWVSADRLPWVRNAKEGLYRSTNFGTTFTRLGTLERAVSFGFGKEMVGKTNPTLYVYGRLTGSTIDAPYYSTDLGASWVSMASSSIPPNLLGDFPTIMEGSRKTAGRVFVGTKGRGIFYSQ